MELKPHTKVKTTVNASQEYFEFLNVTSELHKSEWINGELVLQSPVMDIHSSINLKLTSLLSSYINRNNLGHLVFEKALINFEFAVHNYEPDVAYFDPEKVQYINDDTCLYSTMPDFIVEIISKSTKKNDRGIKFETYQKHKVSEYWIIEPFKKTIEQYLLHKGKYQKPIIYGIKDTIESVVIEGFKTRVEALYEQIYYLAELDKPINDKYKPILKELEQNKQELGQNKQVMEQNKQELEQNKQELEQNKQVMEQNKQELEQNKQILLNTVKALKNSNIPVSEIQKITKLSREEIEKE